MRQVFSRFVVPDLPLEESDNRMRPAGSLVCATRHAYNAAGAVEDARRSTGFLYCVSVAGVTALPCQKILLNVSNGYEESEVPILVGFGISTADQAREVASC